MIVCRLHSYRCYCALRSVQHFAITGSDKQVQRKDSAALYHMPLRPMRSLVPAQPAANLLRHQQKQGQGSRAPTASRKGGTVEK